ncbi:MAG: single-stranded DNA-binding protein [Pseudomonadota bacterium]|nr:single-stranded DNA-binding protein [Pseudomonadota bacterium]
MTGSINKVTLIGNLGANPEVRSMGQSEDEVATLSIATSETWNDRATGERREKTEWHRVVIYNKGLIGVVKNYLKKGKKVYVEGALQTRKYTDNTTGAEKYTTEVVLRNFNSRLVMLDSRGEGESFSSDNFSGDGSQEPNLGPGPTDINTVNAPNDDLDDEIPF